MRLRQHVLACVHPGRTPVGYRGRGGEKALGENVFPPYPQGGENYGEADYDVCAGIRLGMRCLSGVDALV